MSQAKIDYVVEAVRYTPAGEVELFRLYERRGATYSDLVIYTRAALVEVLRAGRLVMAGSRQPYLASTFNYAGSIHLEGSRETPIIVLGDQAAVKDSLPGIPRF